MERYNDFQSQAAASPRALGTGLRHPERPLLRIPILLGVALGLGLGLTRFILVLRESLQEPPSSWSALLFLAVILGGVALFIVLASAAVGFFTGLLLRAGYGAWCTRKRIESRALGLPGALGGSK